ncbi:hypothetical protein Z043_115699, partial [Scleropages formosus]
PVTPPVIKKFLNTTRPEPGKIRVFYGKADDPDVASALIHGLRTKGSTPGGLVINPKPKTLYQQKWQQLQEAVYFSSKNAPLERSHDQSAGLPKGLDTERTTFGVKSVQFINAGEIVNPTKTVEQVEKEAEEGHQLYIKSHNAYFVGERVDRKYNWSRIGKDHRFGVPTPNYSDGRKAAGSLQWLQSDGKLVSKQCDDFRERTQPQIGKVHDPIADTMNVPENHTFGILFRTDGFGVGDLLNSPLTADYTSDPDKWWSLVTAVRQDLKKANFNKFSALLQTFSRYDKSGQGFIDKKDLHNVCLQFNLDLNTPVLESLVEFCEDSKDGQINFMEFTNVLNWKKEIPAELVEQIRAKDVRTYGIPTVRTDLTAPQIKRIGDWTNYGDQSTAYGLLYPTRSSLKGVYEEHYLASRTREEIAQIFRSADVTIHDELFEEAWKLASMRHPKGEVCVESFRNALKEIQAY